MYLKTRSIVISSLKYGENSLIVKCFTKEFGFQSYFLKGVLSSSKKGLKSAFFQPFMQLEVVATHKNNGSLEHIKELKINYLYQSLYTNMYKSSVAMFLSEIISLVCAIDYADHELYLFLEEKLCFFDQNDFSANFHLKFLIDLTRFLGFYPDKIDENSSFFSLEEGIFSDFDETKYSISGKDLELFKAIIKSKYSDLQEIKATRTQRNSLLAHLLKYYQWHLPNFKPIKSLGVLQSFF